ncbi:MAG: hypothetical protein LBL06_00920 [Treponema sp.]|jgi:hypothetical protein|nr:hypothetical protein [Treponema sp.]
MSLSLRFQIRNILYAIFFLFPCQLHAQEPYMVPQTVYVGDKAVLITPLGASLIGGVVEPMSIEPPAPTDGLVVHRIAVERQKDEIRLVVEFTAFKTGVIELPPITAPGFTDEFHLSVTIASLLSPSTMSLSPPAPPLAVSGTAALLYGTSISLILVILLGVSARMFLIRQFLSVSVSFRNRLLIFHIKRHLDDGRKNPHKDRILDNLAAEFRLFLSRFFGIDCSSLTADEFSYFPLSSFGSIPDCPQSPDLRTIFRRLDSFRFNAEGVNSDNVLIFIEDVWAFVEKLQIRRVKP